MAATEGRVARPERRWGCRRGTPLTAHNMASRLNGLKHTSAVLLTTCLNEWTMNA